MLNDRVKSRCESSTLWFDDPVSPETGKLVKAIHVNLRLVAGHEASIAQSQGIYLTSQMVSRKETATWCRSPPPLTGKLVNGQPHTIPASFPGRMLALDWSPATKQVVRNRLRIQKLVRSSVSGWLQIFKFMDCTLLFTFFTVMIIFRIFLVCTRHL